MKNKLSSRDSNFIPLLVENLSLVHLAECITFSSPAKTVTQHARIDLAMILFFFFFFFFLQFLSFL